MSLPTHSSDTLRCGVVAVLGAPNAGKSTFVNHVVGAKVSIVTHKVQTTRTRIRGIAVEDHVQIVYVDTPGIFHPKHRLDRAMVRAAWDGLEGADVCLVMVDSAAYSAATSEQGKHSTAADRRAMEHTHLMIDRLNTMGKKAVLVLNKIDRLPADRLLHSTAMLNERGTFSDTFMVSAAKERGLLDLKRYLRAAMPEGAWLYPEDQLSDISDRLMAAELTREKLFLRLHQELPYALTVETERWERVQHDALRLEQTIYVERDSQKALVLGQKGQTVKAVGAAAREEMAQLFGVPVHLFLFVKVRAKWREDPARYQEMGLGMAP